MSTYEAYEYERGPFQAAGEYEQFETGYETYEGEDEQFLGDILKTVATVTGSPLPGIVKGIAGALGPKGNGRSAKGKGPLSATQEMELTAELLELTSEAELEEFLGNVINGVASAVGGYIGPERAKVLRTALSSIAKSTVPLITGAAKTALPIATGVGGTLAGAALTGPGGGIGAPIGGMIGKGAGDILVGLMEMEYEGMTPEQAEFEAGRGILRVAATSAAHAAKTPQNVPPKKAARAAITKGARAHAPGLLSGAGRGPGAKQQRRARPGARPPGPGGRAPLGAAAYPEAAAPAGAPGFDGGPEPEPDDLSAADPTHGAPDWSEPEPNGDGPEGAGPRGRSGRWIRRGGKIVLLGA